MGVVEDGFGESLSKKLIFVSFLFVIFIEISSCVYTLYMRRPLDMCSKKWYLLYYCIGWFVLPTIKSSLVGRAAVKVVWGHTPHRSRGGGISEFSVGSNSLNETHVVSQQ